LGDDAALISNKTTVGLSFAEQGLSDLDLASSVLLTLTQDAQSAQDAISNFSLSKINPELGTLSNSETYGVSAVDSTTHWYRLYDTITFSFNTSIPEDYYEYTQSSLTDGWGELNPAMKDAARSIMDELNKILGITLQEVQSGGMIQFNMLDMEEQTSGFAFLPGTAHDYYGDLFLSNNFISSPQNYGLEVGEFGYSTIVHELGHALGLKHPFEGEDILPSSVDDTNHSIMSYTSVASYIPTLSFTTTSIHMDYIQIEPSFYSLYDVAALQSIYGVNSDTNSGDNVYTTSYLDYEIKTIWDAGGEDTIDLSTTKGSSTIDLRAGTLNSVDVYSLEDIISLNQDIAAQNSKSQHNDWIAQNITDLANSNDLYMGENNLAIATGVVIENLYTGLGDDIVTDNEVNNKILTSDGNDTIYLGNGGVDYLDAGAGVDKLYLSEAKDNLTITKSYSDIYTISADNYKVDFINVEEIFLNGIEYTPESILV
jgi:hypothetical protein